MIMSETITAGAPVGNKNAARNGLSAVADAATKRAKLTGNFLDHAVAADAHYDAAQAWKDERDDDSHQHHTAMHEEHAKHYQIKNGKAVAAASTESADVVRAAGTSEGAEKGWAHRGSWSPENHMSALGDHSKEISDTHGLAGGDQKQFDAHLASMKAHAKSYHAKHNSDKDYHEEASRLHDHAVAKHREAGNNEISMTHRKLASEHAKEYLKASDTTNTEVIHCRSHSASGPVLAADQPWECGKAVSIMWMPAGTHTICAGFRKGSIELTVNCDASTAEAVQASLESWRQERPRQEPFGCIEHKEQEASFRVGASCGFKWNDDGVYLAAEPTTLGAQNVNGKVHRSWSPSFTTDADYSKATEHNGVLMFPEGVRGSRSNPAQITGVDFCVGTLTNKPAFHAMSPVKAKDAVQAAGTSEGVKKAWESRKRHSNHIDTIVAKDDNDNPLTGEDALDHAFENMPKGATHIYHHDDGGDDGAVFSFTKGSLSPKDVADSASACAEYDFHPRHVSLVWGHQSSTKATSAATSAATTPDTILANHQAKLDRANKIAAGQGALKTTVNDIYERCAVTATGTSEAVKATWSDAARKAAVEARRAKMPSAKRPDHDNPSHWLKSASEKADRHTRRALSESKSAAGAPDKFTASSHADAQDAHEEASHQHQNAADNAEDSGNPKVAKWHAEMVAYHDNEASYHSGMASHPPGGSHHRTF